MLTIQEELRMTLRRMRAACSAVVMAIIFVASGTTGTNCNVTPGGNGGNGGGNNGGVKPTILSSDHILGDASAEITVVEYADFQ